MPNYHRAFRPGGTFFFTLVTYERARFLCDPVARDSLRSAIDHCRTSYPFEIDAFVLLPDHLHAIWTLPPTDSDFSTRWSIIKRKFTQSWLATGGDERPISASRHENRRRGVWQRRFWEHVIRDERDLEKHVHYIHYNPVKHKLASCPHAWDWSSFHRWKTRGEYDANWCCACNRNHFNPPDFDGLDTTAME